jgi:hypothetical protein
VVLLAILSTIQKLIIGAPIGLTGYIVPTVYGGITGLLVGVWAERLRTQNRALLTKIAERRYLLRDLHHRIQNNLQIVSSLLTLNGDDPQGLEESRTRIDLLAMLHQVLYEIGADYHVDLGEFLPIYVSEVCRFRCRCEAREYVSAPELSVPLDTAVVLGMIVNEVVTDLGERYCDAPDHPHFDLVRRENGICSLSITLPLTPSGGDADGEVERSEDLGPNRNIRARLIEVLAGQIDGTIEVTRDAVICCSIMFDPAAQRDTGRFIGPGESEHDGDQGAPGSGDTGFARADSGAGRQAPGGPSDSRDRARSGQHRRPREFAKNRD